MDKQQQAYLEIDLDNWARFFADRSGEPNRRCGSAEGRYLREKVDEERFERGAREKPDQPRAERIDEGLKSMQQKRLAQVLMRWYGNREDEKKLAAFLRCRPFMVLPTRIAALGALQRRLEEMDMRRVRRLLHSRDGSNMYQLPHPNESPVP